MSIESATYISDLNATLPGASDLKSEGDDHIRLIKSVNKNSFPAVAGAVTATHTELSYVHGVTSALQTQIDAKVGSSAVAGLAPVSDVRSHIFTGRPWLAADRTEQYTTGNVNYVPVVAEQGTPSALPTQDSFDWFTKTGATRAPSWKNQQTVRSLELALEYIPAAGVHYISPTPLMMIVAQNDTLTPTDLAIEAFGRAREPKQLVIIPGGHFDAYVSGFEQSSTPALNWFQQHLMK